MGYRYHRVVSVGRLARQHHAVRAVQHLHTITTQCITQHKHTITVTMTVAMTTTMITQMQMQMQMQMQRIRMGWEERGDLPRWPRLRTQPWWVWGW